MKFLNSPPNNRFLCFITKPTNKNRMNTHVIIDFTMLPCIVKFNTYDEMVIKIGINAGPNSRPIVKIA
ncbi:hypothetical protein AC057_14735 [Acinetobacter genomosp. 33YU]|nr:hypothetical protein AC057_14735 [Acinetobacter genomosp. 33YU]